ncbi:Helicase associated domain protein [Streptomyces sp. NPDC101455]|uniref:Helicase associated domain protein n=1 Tax=Streptomyces sp. NPDC101455 TaxID=3366142 RepID=UPI003812DC74
MVGVLPLGEWVYGQRRRRRQGRLAEERAAELEAVPGFCRLPAPRSGNPKLSGECPRPLALRADVAPARRGRRAAVPEAPARAEHLQSRVRC